MVRISESVNITIKNNSGTTLEELRQRAEVALEAVGIHLEGEAKEELENSPRRIDTGLLRNSITHALSGSPTAITVYKGDNESRYGKKGIPTGSYSGNAPDDPKNQQAVYIGTNVEYAAYVHEGSDTASGRHIPPNRFLKNACERNKDQIKRYIETKLKGG